MVNYWQNIYRQPLNARSACHLCKSCKPGEDVTDDRLVPKTKNTAPKEITVREPSALQGGWRSEAIKINDQENSSLLITLQHLFLLSVFLCLCFYFTTPFALPGVSCLGSWCGESSSQNWAAKPAFIQRTDGPQQRAPQPHATGNVFLMRVSCLVSVCSPGLRTLDPALLWSRRSGLGDRKLPFFGGDKYSKLSLINRPLTMGWRRLFNSHSLLEKSMRK